MAEITAEMVKALRDKTSQGFMDCKKALEQAGGDVEAATDILRKKGLATAEKKAGRVTKEGRIGIQLADDGTAAAMVEVQCETDFCARNSVFVAMVSDLAQMALKAGDGPVDATGAMTGSLQAALGKIGENMKYVRGVRITAPQIGAYLHHNNKVGVLVGVSGEIAKDTLSDLCMHVAFADPIGVTANDIPAELLEREKAIATAQAAESGKPAQIVEKMVAGKIAKFLTDKALMDQPFVKDDKKKVKNVLGNAKVTTFARFAVGG